MVSLDEERLVDPGMVQVVRGGRQEPQKNVAGGQRLGELRNDTDGGETTTTTTNAARAP